MPLDRMLFELKPATQSPWFTLRHRVTNTTLAVLPRGAKEGANMVLARAPASGAVQDGDAHLFCFQRGGYLFSKASNGNVNQREQVSPLLRAPADASNAEGFEGHSSSSPAAMSA
eukprot:6172598-Pleurochrysis_carterae.AAC.1